MELTSNDSLTLDIIESGCVTWEDLVRSVRNFKYGRGTSRDAFEQVWYERKGTCSTKHGFLYEIAQRNGFQQVKLMVGIYLMTPTNTPTVAKVLKQSGWEGIPEAHVYLKVGEDYLDATSINSDYSKIASDIFIFTEKEIVPEFLTAEKIEYHKDFLSNWLEETKSERSLEDIWEVREACIQQISEH